MFWIGFGSGAAAAFLICMMAIGIMMFKTQKIEENHDNQALERSEKLHNELVRFWDMSTGFQAEQIQVLKDISNQIRG